MIGALGRSLFRRAVYLLALCAGSSALATVSYAGEPLHARIDRLIEATMLVSPAALADDAEFLRRVSLDLCNRIATADDVRQFLRDRSPNKRAVLIDRLLESPEFARRLANFLDLTLMERRGDKYVGHADWEAWLYQVSLENRPWDKIVCDVIRADGSDPGKRAPAKFTLEREADPNLVTRDVGRMFFGRDVQCAQCHDHPLVKDFEQREYYGLLSFFQRTELFKDPKGVYMLAEKADGDATFHSVFVAGSKHAARPALPGGTIESDPRVEPGKEYVVAPDGKARAVPAVSRREQFAKALAGGANAAFNRNVVNRLWAMMMGRGIVQPVDFDHADNPPSHPELLDLLAREFAASKYDIRSFLRELALTDCYQRSFDRIPTLESDAERIAAQIPSLEAELAKSEQTVTSATAAWKATHREAIAAQDAVDKAVFAARSAESALVAARKASSTAESALAGSKQQSKSKSEAQSAISTALEPVRAALAKLAGDADLKLVADKLQAKAAQLAGEMKTLEKAIESQTAASAKANEALKAATRAVEEFNAKREQVEKAGEPAITKRRAAHDELQRAKATLAVHKRRLQVARLLTQFRAKLNSFAEARAQAGSVPDELRSAERARSDAAARERLVQGQLTKLGQELAAAQKQIAAAQADLRARQAALDALPSAVEQVEKSAAAVKDTELTKAASVVRQRLTALSAGLATAQKQLAERDAARQALARKADSLHAEKVEVDRALTAAEATAKRLQSQHKVVLGRLQNAQQQFDSARRALFEVLSDVYAVAPLKPLTPEQIHWSILQASGILGSYEVSAAAEFAKKHPAPSDTKANREWAKERTAAVEKEAHGKLAGNLAPFVHLYGCGPGQSQFEFFSTADQALFMENSDHIRSWTAAGTALVQRLVKTAQPAALGEELYLSVFNRKPTADEAAEVAQWLSRHNGPSPDAISELAWALMASAEFRFNH